MNSIHRRVGRFAAFLLVAGTVATTPLTAADAAPAARPAPTVSIHVEMDLPTLGGSSGPRVFDVKNVTAGAGIELTAANQTSNPSNWQGNVEVDVNPDAKTVTVLTQGPGGQGYQTTKVTVSSPDFSTLSLVSDDVMTPGVGVVVRSLSGGAGAFQINWVASGSNYYLLKTGGQAVFSYGTVFNTSAAPAVSGKTKVGKTLTLSGVSPTSFTPAADRVDIQWYRIIKRKHHKTKVKPIGGATGATFKARRADRGHRLQAVVNVIGEGVPTLSYTVVTRKIRG